MNDSSPIQDSTGYGLLSEWMQGRSMQAFPFQEQAWQQIQLGHSGLVNAPTGCGKTYAVFLGALIRFINAHEQDYASKKNNGLQLLWITPLRALAKDIGRAMEEVIAGIGLQWRVGIRNGDTELKEREKQKRQIPEIMIITPESLHLFLAQKGYPERLRTVQTIAIDEWHELIGSKRGVQVELALSRLLHLQRYHGIPTASIWGISATIGNLEEAMEVLMAPLADKEAHQKNILIKAAVHKTVRVDSIVPDEIEKYPWAGHLGLKLVHKVIPVIREKESTLIFINTRGMSELWYQAILTAAPDLAGAIALHHGSIDRELRDWVEENLHTGRLKAVVCTASLDLGVDFRPVDTVIQVGSPKGVARFLQRAGRSGHRPDEVSQIYFLPTHSLELLEAAALKEAIAEEFIESRPPLMLCFDVLIQYCCTLAISEGFEADTLLKEIRTTFCYRDITDEEWAEILYHIHSGGNALQQYEEYKKVECIDGLYRMPSRRLAMRHRMHIGTIVSDAMLKVKFFSGGYVGVIEEYFISRLEPGDVFTLAGRNLELVMIKEMTVLVKKSNAKKSQVPSWVGGRMPLSANLGKKLRQQLSIASSMLSYQPTVSHKGKDLFHQEEPAKEIRVLEALLQLQEDLSRVPRADELLIEQIETKDGFHLFVFPFEGRLVHEAMAAILAYRISRIRPITFSFAMNDYGFELLSDQPIPVDDSNVYELFSPDHLFEDIQRSVNSTEMAKRKFRDIAVIGGLIFQGYPGEHKKARHLQASASLLFKVFSEYEKNNLLLRQAYQEVFDQQMEEQRLREMLQRIQEARIVLTFPEKLTPFCFPIKVDSMREDLSSEKLEDRVRKMQQQLST